MSEVEIYAIRRSGDVVRYGESSNSHGHAMLIWAALGKEYGIDIHAAGGMARLWPLAHDTTLDAFARVALATTFDNVWFSKERLASVVTSLIRFGHHYESHATLVGLCVSLTEIRMTPLFMGAALNVTSVNPNPWVVRAGTDRYGQPKLRPFNVRRDTTPYVHFPNVGPVPAREITQVLPNVPWLTL